MEVSPLGACLVVSGGGLQDYSTGFHKFVGSQNAKMLHSVDRRCKGWLSNDFSALFSALASRGIQVETTLVPCATIASRHIRVACTVALASAFFLGQ